MSVNIVQNGTLIPIAGKTVPAPTPDYVDEQFDSSKTYSKGMTCIEGNVRYRYKNSTATSGHRPPDATYWEVLSVSDEMVSKTKNSVVDLNEFKDYISWTNKGQYATADLISSITGGFKKVGNICYVNMEITPKNSSQSWLSNYWTNGGGGGLDDFLPRPYINYVPLSCYISGCVSQAFIYKTGTGSGESKLRGEMGVKGTFTSLPSSIRIMGAYSIADDNQI